MNTTDITTRVVEVIPSEVGISLLQLLITSTTADIIATITFFL